MTTLGHNLSPCFFHIVTRMAAMKMYPNLHCSHILLQYAMGLYEEIAHLFKYKHMIIDGVDIRINSCITQGTVFYQISKLLTFSITCSKLFSLTVQRKFKKKKIIFLEMD